MAKFDIKTVKPKFVVTTSPENKIDVVVNKPIITSKNTKSFFQLKNTGGPKGDKGDQGEPGQNATITVASTSTGAPGTNASVVNQGTEQDAQLAFTIPRGDKGDKGDTGAAGFTPKAWVARGADYAQIFIEGEHSTSQAKVYDGTDGQDGQAATITVDSTTTLPAGSSATVTNVGTSSAASLAFGIPKGDTGAAGADGDAATIQVGQVETLEPNQQAYVTNVGTSSEAIFNIGIPKGQKGDSGSGSGDMTASVYDPNGTVAAAGGIPDYVDSNGGKIDTIKVNGTAQTITNKTVDISVPTKTSDLTNDGSDNTSTYVEADELATVATSGNYNDLSNKPTIPAAQVNSDWSANSGVAQILNKPNLATVATSGSYSDLSNKPTIPTVNDATLTITQNGTSAGTFTANALSDTTIALTDTTYNAMTGASSSTAGTSGLVPAPSAGDQNDVLKGDGTWGLIGAYNLDDFSTANTADTWMLVGANEKIQHRVVKPFNADGSIPTSAIADGAVTADKLDNTDSWVLIAEATTTEAATGTFLTVSIPSTYGSASLKISAKFELQTNGNDNWVDLRGFTASGQLTNCVSGIQVAEDGTISANSTHGQFSSEYIINASDNTGWRAWNIEATSLAPGSNWRTWLAKSGNGYIMNDVASRNDTNAPITSITLVTAGQAQVGATLKVWGRID